MSSRPSTLNTVRSHERLTFYLPHWLNREVRLAADKAGQPVSTFITRALETVLGKTGPTKREASR
jgi:hypothetical protein